ncbi:UNVERIFIED_CONTAM: hypothetical protein QOZ12_28890, partial [Pseudomonas aeruginosa]
MMQKLQRAFGEVVDAAVHGDFSRRVTADFADAELNSLAHSVNNLVETVDRGLNETGEVFRANARQVDEMSEEERLASDKRRQER